MLAESEAILAALRRGATVITATQRLRREVLQQFQFEQQSQGVQSWPTPDVIPWGMWRRRCWLRQRQYCNDNRLILSEVQFLRVWEHVVEIDIDRNYPEEKALWDIVAAAAMAARAWQLSHDWQIPLCSGELFLTQDQQVYQRWRRAYTRYCEEKNWIDEASAGSSLLDKIDSLTLVEQEIYFAGFDQYTPQQLKLIAQLRNRHIDVSATTSITNPDNQNGSAAIFFDSDEAELLACANSARRRLMQQPGSQIAIVLTRFDALRDLADRVFTEVLHPSAALLGSREEGLTYHLAAGGLLADTPLVSDALLLLSLAFRKLSADEISRLLLSPFTQKYDSALNERAKLDARLRSNGYHQIGLAEMIHELSVAEQSDRDDDLHDSIKIALKAIEQRPPRQQPSRWAEWIDNWLTHFYWPGARVLDSTEYQAHHSWRELLEEFSRLDVVMGDISWPKANRLVTQLANAKRFQAEMGDGAIQILSHSEAGGMRFDELWMAGLDAESWPLKPRPNPFIPLSLQVEAGIPSANIQLQTALCSQILQRLQHSAKKVTLSYAQSDDGITTRPSPLVTRVGVDKNTNCEPVGIFLGERFISQAVTLEQITDERAPVLSQYNVSGGANILKDQSACPFRAFAKHRLAACVLEQPEPGLSPLERGSLVHKIMQEFWSQFDSLSALSTFDASSDHTQDGALVELIYQKVQAVLQRFQSRAPHKLSPAVFKLERERLSRLLRDWIDVEHGRQPFRIRELERKHTIEIGKLKLNLRIDRVDELSDGSWLVIDYKTNDVTASQWQTDRPKEPQLPLYRFLLGDRVGGIAFACLKRGNLRYVFYAKEPLINESNKKALGSDQWQLQVEEWDEALIRLANDFCSGVARVDPRKMGEDCRYCEVRPLCRIDELQQLPAPENDYQTV